MQKTPKTVQNPELHNELEQFCEALRFTQIQNKILWDYLTLTLPREQLMQIKQNLPALAEEHYHESVKLQQDVHLPDFVS